MTRAYAGEDAGQLAMFECAKGERFQEAAREWIRKNHGTWLWMCQAAARHAAEERRFSIARLVEEARYTKPVQGVDEYKINNDLRAPLARMLVEAVPQCAPYIQTRSSAVDLVS